MESLGEFPNEEWEFFGKIFANELDHELLFTSPPQFLDQNSSTLLFGDHDDVGLNKIGLIQSTFCSEVASENDDENMFCSNFQYISSQESSYNNNSSSNNCSEDINNSNSNVFIANQGLVTTTNFYYSHYPHHVDDSSFCMDEKNFASFVPSSLSDTIMMNRDIIVGSDEKLEKNSDNTHQMEPMVSPNTKQFQLKRKVEEPEQEEILAEDKTENRSKIQRKKPCVSKDVNAIRSRKKQKDASRNGNETEDTTYDNAGLSEHGQSSSSSISEDDYNNNNNSHENIVGGAIITSSVSQSTLNANGKPRASRGSATDPQSLYARKRRERINERLRILQNLVPNGTKVDISTMLEEALNYVKFLQLQIKLLSSDELWMYAPLAYNGLDIGLNINMKNSPTL